MWGLGRSNFFTNAVCLSFEFLPILTICSLYRQSNQSPIPHFLNIQCMSCQLLVSDVWWPTVLNRFHYTVAISSTVSRFPLRCRSFLYVVAISIILSRFPLRCRDFLYAVEVSCMLSQFPLRCRDFHYGEPALNIPSSLVFIDVGL